MLKHYSTLPYYKQTSLTAFLQHCYCSHIEEKDSSILKTLQADKKCLPPTFAVAW